MHSSPRVRISTLARGSRVSSLFIFPLTVFFFPRDSRRQQRALYLSYRWHLCERISGMCAIHQDASRRRMRDPGPCARARARGRWLAIAGDKAEIYQIHGATSGNDAKPVWSVRMTGLVRANLNHRRDCPQKRDERKGKGSNSEGNGQRGRSR